MYPIGIVYAAGFTNNRADWSEYLVEVDILEHNNLRIRKIVISVIFGLIGFVMNFCHIEVIGGPQAHLTILLGLFFPLIISLAWGWRYGLLSALAGGCQSMWWVWSRDGWGLLYAVPVFTLWIVYHGWWADRRRGESSMRMSSFIVEIPFRIVINLGFYTIFRWLVSFNPPFWAGDVTRNMVPVSEVHLMTVRYALSAYVLLITGHATLSVGRVRDFFGLQRRPRQHDTDTVYTIVLFIGFSLWIIDSLAESFLFSPDVSFLEAAVLDVSPHTMLIRFLYMILSLTGALMIAHLLTRQDLMNRKLKNRNRVLFAIRDISQLVTHEKDRDGLLAQICQVLVERHGVHNAWIVLTLGKDRAVAYYHSGFNGSFASMADLLDSGRIPDCAQAALESGEVTVTDDPLSQCGECPLSGGYGGRKGLVARLEHDGHVYGWFSIAIPKEVVDDVEELLLFREIADDIAYALWSIETEAEKRATEQRYASILTTTSDAVVAFDADETITLFNPGAEKMFGVAAEHVLGKSFKQFVPDDRMEECAQALEWVLQEGSVHSYETERKTADGRLLPVDISLSAHFDASGNFIGYSAILRDISDRKRIEQVLLESEKEIRAFYDTAPLPYQSLDSEGNLLDVNQHWLRTLGYSREEVIGRNFSEFIHPDTAAYFKDAFRSFKEQGILHDVQFRLRHKKGHYIDVVYEGRIDKKADGSFDRTCCVFHDITEQKRAKDALEKRILALMRSLEDVGSIRFEELFNIADIQRLQDEYAKAIGLASVITTPDGIPITELSNSCRLCSDIIRKTERGRLEYSRFEEEIGKHHSGMPVVQQCEVDGLWYAAAAITVGEKHIASWLIGQVRDEMQTDEHIRAYAREIGVDEEDAAAAFQEVTVMPLQRFKAVVQAISIIADIFSSMAYQNMQQARFIMERKQSEKERDLLMSAIEQAAEAIVITDKDGIIQYVNPAFEEITGYSREEVEGESLRILKSGKQDNAIYEELWEQLTQGRPWKGRFVNKKKDGTLYTEETVISPVFDESNHIINYVAVKRDISEEIRLEEQLYQSQKMESIGRLAGGVAHDFNNLLMGIMGYVDLCRDAIDDDHHIQRYLDEIMSASERSARLTRQLLAFARKQTVSPQVLNLNSSIRSMLGMLHRMIGEEIELIWEPGENLGNIKMDPSQLDQILANLVVNARDAIDGVGKLKIQTARCSIGEQHIAAPANIQAGEFVRLSVEDTGEGMDKEALSHLFEPFFTSKQKEQGIGLGLATVHGIVKQNGGFISVDSKVGVGTKFEIYLPVCAEKDVHVADKSETTDAIDGTAMILVVEDERSIRVTISALLKSLGYTVHTADSPSQALQFVKQHADEIDLLITDIIMPEMNGRDLADRLMKIYPDLKCLFMSGYAADVFKSKGVEDDFAFLQKPFTKDELAAKISQVLSR